MTTYPIPPDLARRAAADYLVIRKAGLLWELEREIELSIEAHQGVLPECPTGHDWAVYRARSLDRWRHGRGYQLQTALGCAGELAEMLDCPQSAIEPHIVPELIGEQTRRTIVLDCLRNVANRARKELARGRREMRRSA